MLLASCVVNNGQNTLVFSHLNRTQNSTFLWRFLFQNNHKEELDKVKNLYETELAEARRLLDVEATRRVFKIFWQKCLLLQGRARSGAEKYEARDGEIAGKGLAARNEGADGQGPCRAAPGPGGRVDDAVDQRQVPVGKSLYSTNRLLWKPEELYTFLQLI